MVSIVVPNFVGLSKFFFVVVVLGFVGYASVIADIIADDKISDTDDDQLYYTKIYLDETKRVRGYRHSIYSCSIMIDNLPPVQYPVFMLAFP